MLYNIGIGSWPSLHRVRCGNLRNGHGMAIQVKYSLEVMAFYFDCFDHKFYLIFLFFSSLRIKVKSFHLKWRGANSDANIGKWSITVIELDEHKRHLDRARLLTFWDELDK